MLPKLIFILFLTCQSLKGYLTETRFPILIVISFDGFRHDYIEHAETPNLHGLANDGVRATWMNNVFVTKTFPNHFSIATGLYEDVHGIVSNYMYDPEWDAIFDASTMHEERWWNNNFSTPIWIANQNSDKDRHSGCVFWSGSEVPYFGGKRPKYIQKYNSSVSWTERVDIAIGWLTSKTEPANLILFYFEEPDATGHTYGPDSEEVKEQIRRADNITGYLVEKLQSVGLFSKTNIIVLSDHGMATVNNIINLDEFVDNQKYKTYGVTPVFNLWPKKIEEEDIIYRALKEASTKNNFSVYKPEEIPERFHYKHHRRILKIIVEADEGYHLVNSEFPEDHQHALRGDHGYDNSLSSMHPIFIAHGPAFKKHYISDPFLNLDVYPLMCNILGIPIPSNNGSLLNIQHILYSYGGVTYPAYFAVAVCSLVAFLLIGGAYRTASRFKPSISKSYRYSNEHHFPEEKENLLFSEE